MTLCRQGGGGRDADWWQLMTFVAALVLLLTTLQEDLLRVVSNSGSWQCANRARVAEPGNSRWSPSSQAYVQESRPCMLRLRVCSLPDPGASQTAKAGEHRMASQCEHAVELAQESQSFETHLGECMPFRWWGSR